MWSWIRGHKKITGALVAASATSGLLMWDYQYNEQAFTRNFRSLRAAAGILVDYKLFYDPENVHILHDKAAQRILSTCQKNGGLYIKLGQGIAAMNHVLPPQYSKAFSVLYDKAPGVPYDAIEKIFMEDLGKKPEEVFSTFDHEAIASASIAQVHRARLKDGTEVAVKIQKPQIRVQIDWDLAMYGLLTYLFEQAFDLPLYWSVPFTSKQLRKETDFITEGKNSERAAANFNTDDYYAPKVYWENSTSRILITEWIDGVKITDQAGLAKINVTPKQIITYMTKAFGDQIFVHGFIHADPHQGNMLVRRTKRGKPQLVILDHGLYVEETEAFRRQYCELWKAMVLIDKQKLQEICKSWGIKDADLFASVNLMKPYNPNKAVHLQNTSKADIARMQMEMKGKIKDVLENTALIPQEIIFVGRCLNLLRSNNKALNSPVNRVNILAQCAAKGSQHDRWDHSWRGRLKDNFRELQFELNLSVISFAFYLGQLWQSVNSIFGRKVVGFEEAMEMTAKQTIEEKLGFTVSVDEAT